MTLEALDLVLEQLADLKELWPRCQLLLPTLLDQSRDDLVAEGHVAVLSTFNLPLVKGLEVDTATIAIMIGYGVIEAFFSLDYLIWIFFFLAVVVHLAHNYLGTGVFLNHVVLSLGDIIVERYLVVPHFPEDHAEAVNVHGPA